MRTTIIVFPQIERSPLVLIRRRFDANPAVKSPRSKIAMAEIPPILCEILSQLFQMEWNRQFGTPLQEILALAWLFHYLFLENSLFSAPFITYSSTTRSLYLTVQFSGRHRTNINKLDFTYFLIINF